MASRTCLGLGTYGRIYITDDSDVVCKMFIKKHCISFPVEYAAMLLLTDIPHVLQLIRADFSTSRLFTRRYMTNLNTYNIKNRPGLADITYIVRCILQGLDQAHSRGIIHRDIKSNNIFLDYDDTGVTQVVIGDWGSAYPLGVENDRGFDYQVQNICYRAPEVMARNRRITSKIDIWSVGCILIELVSRRRFLSAATSEDISALMQVFRCRGTPESFRQYFPNFKASWVKFPLRPDIQSETVYDLLEHLMDVDPISRYTCAEALEHEFFRSKEVNDVTEQDALAQPVCRSPALLQEVDRINVLTDRHRYSDRTRRLAHYYYWICVKQIDYDFHLESIAETCLTLAAIMIDYRQPKSVPSDYFMMIFDMVKHDLFGIQHFGRGSEAFSQLAPMRMLARPGSLPTHFYEKMIVEGVSYKYTDDRYDYCVITINSYTGNVIKDLLLTPKQISSLNMDLSKKTEGWSHFATFEGQYKYLVMRREQGAMV